VHQRPPRLPAEDRRRQLLDTALDFFSRKGFQGTTTKEIAAAAGITEAIIFRHFPSKQALYTAVLDYQYESGETAALLTRWKAFMDVNDDVGLFRSLISSVIESHRRDARVKRALLFAALEGHETGLELHRQRSMPVFELICQYVARRQSEGAIRPGNPAAIAASAFTMAAHYAMLTEFFGFRAQVTDEQITESFLDILLHGIQPALTEKVTP
jgi:TetR/AcrR family transcriptional regulator